MAIDMIERTTEGAHAPSRLGNHQFADESREFKNFTGGQEFFQGGGEDWANLFGSQLRKKHLKENQDAERKAWAAYPEKTCDDIQKKLNGLSTRGESIVKELAAKPKDAFLPVRLAVVREIEGKLKGIQTQLDCVAIQAKAQSEATKAETLATLTTLSEKSIQNAKSDLLGVDTSTSTTSNKNLLLYGGIGLGVILLIVLLRKK
jgi:hypothetical protein